MSLFQTAGEQQFLTFRLAAETFAIAVDKVREIMDITTITKVPQAPDFLRGVINLRGSVVPVIDLHLKFGMGATQHTVNTCIIVVEVCLDTETVILGAVADMVLEVFNLEQDQIEPAPRIGTNLNTDFLKGMGKHNDSFIMILDIDRVMVASDLDMVHRLEDRAA
jgi:purine-binding chemotaxis protein CheW